MPITAQIMIKSMKCFHVLHCLQYKTSAHKSQREIAEDFDISYLILFIELEGVDFLQTMRSDLEEVRIRPYYVSAFYKWL